MGPRPLRSSPEEAEARLELERARAEEERARALSAEHEVARLRAELDAFDEEAVIPMSTGSRPAGEPRSTARILAGERQVTFR